jgi:hypothetical protein
MMNLLQTVLDESKPWLAAGGPLPLPEYRQIELYTKRKKLSFQPPLAADAAAVAGLARAELAFNLLERHFAAADPLLFEGVGSWQRYLALPRKGSVDKLAAELYRILRIIHIASLHASGHVEAREGLVRMSCVFNRCALSLNLTPCGLDLLAGAVFYYLDSFSQPYSEAYVELLLLQYFDDLVAEIRKFADEDRVLFQFRHSIYFNRHFRYDCDNPRYQHEESFYVLEIGPRYRDRARYPIDFYLPLTDGLCIVPVEALQADGRLPLADLPRWQARHCVGAALPDSFQMRFGREEMVVGLPMT